MTTTTLGRGICKDCGRSQKMTQNGKIGGHDYLNGRCTGQGKNPKKTKSSKSKPSNTPTTPPTTQGVKKSVKKKTTKKVSSNPSNTVNPVSQSGKKKKTTKKSNASNQVAVGTTYVAVVLDDSASMRSLRMGACNAFNALCQPIREQGDDYKTSYYIFGSSVKAVWLDKQPKKLPLLTPESYTANQVSTSLFDAIGAAIETFKLKREPDASFLVIVITDGHENSSRSWNERSLSKEIKAVQATDRWTFAISCPRNYAQTLATRLNIPLGNFQEWDQTDAGVLDMGHSNQGAIARFTQQRSTGAKSVKNFYVNIGRQSAKKVQQQLSPVNKNQYRKLTTSASCAVKDFVESKQLSFRKGCVFYSLQKPETVQSYKEIILERRDTGAMFSGPAVRDLLGIPVGADGRVKPGNLGEWIVWVQSTSVNRKLLAKMEILYDRNL